MVELYITDIKNILSNMNVHLNSLTAQRREKAKKFYFLEDSLRCIAGGLLLQKILNVKTDNEIEYTIYEKPFLKNDSRFFNLSHSGDYVIMAVSDKIVGVDIEKIKTADMEVAKKCFQKAEIEYLQNHPLPDKIFYSLWTRKESLMKATGYGLNMAPESFCVLPIDSSEIVLDGQTWYFKHYTLNEDYAVSVCAQQNSFALKPEIVFFNE